MANEIIDLKVFDGAGPDPAFGPRSAEDSLADGIMSAYGIIYYQGAKWSMRHGSDRKFFVRPDDGTQASYIDVVILAAADHLSKTYYPKWDPGSAAPPTCMSLDGIKPDPGVPAKQSETCGLCPHNEWKMQENGRRGKRCQDNKRVAVFVMPSSQKMPGEKYLFGEAIIEPALLRVPPASLKALAALGREMEGRGYDSYTYVTRINFVPNTSHPQMEFKAIQRLTAQHAQLIQDLRNHDLIPRIIAGGRRDMALPPVTVAAGFAPSPPVHTNGPVIEAQAQTPAPGPTVADTGPTDETDEALDAVINARLNAMMPPAG